MQTAESLTCRTAASACRRKAKRSENPRAWLSLADSWDALAKVREEAPIVAPRVESPLGAALPMGSQLRKMRTLSYWTGLG